MLKDIISYVAIGQKQAIQQKKRMFDIPTNKDKFGHIWDVHNGYRVWTHNHMLLALSPNKPTIIIHYQPMLNEHY